VKENRTKRNLSGIQLFHDPVIGAYHQ